MESGWGKNYLCAEILRTWYSGLPMWRRASGESPIHENSLPMQSELTIESEKEESVCVWVRPGHLEGRVSCLTSSPCDPPPAQTTTKWEGNNWGPGPVSLRSHDIGTIFCCLSTFTLPQRNIQMNTIKYFVLQVGTPLICLFPLAVHIFRKLRSRFVF